jgi:hypothetical protein
MDVGCAIIEHNAVNRSFIKSLNPAADNVPSSGSVRLSSVLPNTAADRCINFNKIKILMVVFAG